MIISPSQVIDETYSIFSRFQTGADLGQREIGLDNGAHRVSLDSFFIPTLSGGNGGYLVSKVRALQAVKQGQPEKALMYTNISGLENVRGPQKVSDLFKLHLLPPGGEKVGILNVYGSLVHYGFQKSPEEITENQSQTARYNIETHFNVIVISRLSLDSRFNTLKVLQEAAYNPQAPMTCFGKVLDDLKKMPIYRISR